MFRRIMLPQWLYTVFVRAGVVFVLICVTTWVLTYFGIESSTQKRGKLISDTVMVVQGPFGEALVRVEKSRGISQFFCGKFYDTDPWIYNGILKGETVYEIFHEENVDSPYANAINTQTGVVSEHAPLSDLPSDLASLRFSQVYGSEKLPDGLMRANQVYDYDASPQKEHIISTSDACVRPVITWGIAVAIIALAYLGLRVANKLS